MNWERAARIANAVLYEGFLLYPYRPSSVKNQHRWTFGVLYPPGYVARTGAGDRCDLRTEVLLEGSAGTIVAFRLRCLVAEGQAVVERALDMGPLTLAQLSGGESSEASLGTVRVALEARAVNIEDALYRLSVQVRNLTASAASERDEALMASLLSCHLLLGAEAGAFVSLTDPPLALRAHADACVNTGVWPVMVGEPGARDLMLASPIILADHPAVASESPGELFDGTEIDEILTLRILTLSDAEKDEVRRGDERAAALLERTEALGPEELLGLHAEMRSAGDTRFTPGRLVRLRPKGRADIFDLALEGKVATVLSLEEDLEGTTYVTVTVNDDPGQDLGRLGQPGHRFFFRPDEVELL